RAAWSPAHSRHGLQVRGVGDDPVAQVVAQEQERAQDRQQARPAYTAPQARAEGAGRARPASASPGPSLETPKPGRAGSDSPDAGAVGVPPGVSGSCGRLPRRERRYTNGVAYNRFDTRDV